MRNFLRLAAAFLLIMLLCSSAFSEDVIDLTLAIGEHWTIPEDRLGECTITNESVLKLEDGQLIGVKPGRAEVRIHGKCDTLLRVLDLYTEAADATVSDPDTSSAAVHPASDYRYYTVLDEDDTQDDLPPESDEDDEVPDGASTETAPSTEIPAVAESEPVNNETAESTASAATAPEPQAQEPAESEAETDITVQAYDRSAVPEAINTVIDFALDEWRTAANQTFSRAGSKNKYSFWQCGKGPKCNIGWCGAFLGYVFDTCGIPMDEPTKSVPHESGEPYSVHAAGVGKINKGFEKMNRLTMVPKPGYLVVYGEQKAYGYKHIGLVTDVDDLGGGVYLLKTVEGNMSNRIKRYCYLFDSNEPIKNTKPCPDKYRRTDGEINDYEHIKKWNITTFCQTWF